MGIMDIFTNNNMLPYVMRSAKTLHMVKIEKIEFFISG